MSEVEAKQFLQKNLKKNPNLAVVLLDFADSTVKRDKATEEFFAMIKVSSEKVSRKKRPTFFLKGDNRVSQVPVTNISGNAALFD